MRRFVIAVAVVTSIGMVSGTAQACTKVPPKSWAGTIDVIAPTGASLAVAAFKQNNCSWGSNAQLNGFDGLVLDVTKYGGLLAKVTLSMGTAPFRVSGGGTYLSTSCAAISSGAWTHTADGTPFTVSIPAGAKWLLVTATSDTTVVSDQLQFAMTSSGRRCRR